MDWANTERVLEPQSPQRTHLRVATCISILLHGLLAVALIWVGEDSQRPPVRQAAGVLSISLVNLRPAEPVVPATLIAEPGSVLQIPQEAVAVDSNTRPPDQLAGPSQKTGAEELEVVADPTVLESAILVPDVPQSTESDRILKTPALPPVITSPLTMQQTVREFALARRGDRILRACTPLQAQNELLDCPDSEIFSAQTALQSRLDLSFNVSAESDRSRAAMGTIAANRQQLQENLEDTGLDSADADYLKEQLSQGIEVYSGSGNAPLERLQDQIYRNDEAYQQAQRVLNPR